MTAPCCRYDRPRWRGREKSEMGMLIGGAAIVVVAVALVAFANWINGGVG